MRFRSWRTFAMPILGAVIVLSGVAIWKPVELAPLTSVFGGYMWARYWHFMAMVALFGSGSWAHLHGIRGRPVLAPFHDYRAVQRTLLSAGAECSAAIPFAPAGCRRARGAMMRRWILTGMQ